MHQNRKRNIEKARKLPYFSNRQCWNLDYYLAKFIAGGLRSFLKMKRYGVPNEYAEKYRSEDDKELKAASEAWDNDLRKMLWAFEEIASDYRNDPHSIWFDKAYKETEAKGLDPFGISDGNTLQDNMPDMPKEVWEAHKEYGRKIQEGTELFGKHFQSLWD